MKPLSERIKDFPNDQFIDWLCLSCVDVREVRSEDDAQEEINKIRAAVSCRMDAAQRRIAELEAAFNKSEEDKQELLRQKYLLIGANLESGCRARKVEEELARRDAAAGEPVACLYASGDFLTRAECNDDRTFAICCKVETPLFTAAQPSAKGSK